MTLIRTALVTLSLLGAAACVVSAAEELPPFWIAVSAGGAELDAGPQARPPAPTTEPVAAVAPGQTLALRAKLVGGRRAYMMWPETFANVGPNTTIEARGFDQMAYSVRTETFFGRGEWTVTDEQYTWQTGGRGALSATDQSGERVLWTAPAEPGTCTLTVSGQVKFHFVRQAPGGTVESDEDSGQLSRAFTIVVQGPAAAQTMTPEQARQHIMTRFQALGQGPVEGSAPTYVGPAGFWNNVYSVFNDSYDNYVCGGWQGKVLQMLDAMRNGSPEEKAVFDHFDYGPIQAYYGGHQAVVIYPKGSDWRQSGTVLDPWPNQRPETFSMAAWSDRFWFGVGPSSVYQDLYPLTGAADYAKPHLRIPDEHMAALRRLPADLRQQYLNLTNANDRSAFIANLPPAVRESTAVGVQSPVRMLVTDALGRSVGWQDEASFAYEIPGVDVDLFPEADGSFGMVALLPYGDYDVRVTGDGAGSFTLLRALPASVAASPLSSIRDVPIVPGQQFTYRLAPSTPDAPLQGSDGSTRVLAAVPVAALTGGSTIGSTTAATGTGGAGGGSTTPAATAGATTGGATTTTGGAVPTAGAAVAEGVSITMPTEGQGIVGRVEVRGTGKSGALIVVSTEVRAQANDELLRDVPGSRARIGEDGTWQVWVAAPVLPANVMQPLYYILKAHWATPDGQQSGEARVKLYRAG